MELSIESGIFGVVKLFFWTLALLFIIFSAIVVRQTQLMNRVLMVPITGGLKSVSFGLLAFAIGIFLVSLVLL